MLTCSSVSHFVRLFLHSLDAEPSSSNGAYTMESIQRAIVNSHIEHVLAEHRVTVERPMVNVENPSVLSVRGWPVGAGRQ